MKQMLFLLLLVVAACTRPTTTISLSANVLIPLDVEMPAEETLHPIDLQWEACHTDTAHQTTYGMIECENRALEAWKAEMERAYHGLMDSLDAEQKELLRQSQQAWEEFFRAETEFSTQFYLDKDGTMWQIYIVSRQRELFRERALALKEFADCPLME